MRIPYISLLTAGALALGGCAYGSLGYGGGYGGYGPYGGYGYGGSSISIGYSNGYYDPYGYGSPYYGWYDNYYYPGSGYYVYDTYRRPHVMTSTQRSYWSSRSPSLRTDSSHRTVRQNWSGFEHRTSTRSHSTREEREALRDQRRDDRRHRPD